MRLIRHLNEAFNNWTFPDDKTMKSDFSEYKKKEKKKWFSRSKMMGMRWPLFKDFNHFRHSLRTADVMKLTPSLDSKITNRSHSHSIEDLKQLVNGYIRPRDVDRIVDGFENNDRMPYPIVLRTRRGMWIMAGNTRLDASFIMDITPTVLIVDVDNELSEQSVDITHELNLIKNDCQPFIKMAKPCRGLTVRSATNLMSTNFIKKKTRKDRQPLSTPVNTHKMLDTIFLKMFGWKVRSGGVFTYGHEGFLYSHYFFPIGKFKFVYSPLVKDLYDYLIELKHDLKIPWEEIEIHDLSYIMNTYTNKNLCAGIKGGKSEIVFKCKEYYLLRTTTIHPDDLRDYLYK
jgi:hypothetical protein